MAERGENLYGNKDKQQELDKTLFQAANQEWIKSDERRKFRREPQKLSPGPEIAELHFDYKETEPETLLSEIPLEEADKLFAIFPNYADLRKRLPEKALRDILETAIEELKFTDLEQLIIRSRLENHTLTEVAELSAHLTKSRQRQGKIFEAGTPVGRERIRQIEQRLIRRLRRWHERQPKNGK